MTAVEVNAGGAVVKLRRPWVGARALPTGRCVADRLGRPVLGHGAVALILTYSGIPLGIAATVLMQQRLTRLWAAG